MFRPFYERKAAAISFALQHIKEVAAIAILAGCLFWGVTLGSLAAYSNASTLWFRWTIPMVLFCAAMAIALSDKQNRGGRGPIEIVSYRIVEKKIIPDTTGNGLAPSSSNSSSAKGLVRPEDRYVFVLEDLGVEGRLWEQTVTKKVYFRYKTEDWYPIPRS